MSNHLHVFFQTHCMKIYSIITWSQAARRQKPPNTLLVLLLLHHVNHLLFNLVTSNNSLIGLKTKIRHLREQNQNLIFYCEEVVMVSPRQIFTDYVITKVRLSQLSKFREMEN